MAARGGGIRRSGSPGFPAALVMVTSGEFSSEARERRLSRGVATDRCVTGPTRCVRFMRPAMIVYLSWSDSAEALTGRCSEPPVVCN